METIQEERRRLRLEEAELKCQILRIKLRRQELKKTEKKKKMKESTPAPHKERKEIRKENDFIKHTPSKIGLEEKQNINCKNVFEIPSVDEVQAYMDSKGETRFTAEYFWTYYDSRGWKPGNGKLESWRRALDSWIERENNKASRRKGQLGKPQQNVVTFNAYKPVDRTGTVSYEEYLKMKTPQPPLGGGNIVPK